MKGATILLGLLVAVVAVNAECPLASMVMKTLDECKDSLNVSDDVLERVTKGEDEDNKEVKCFHACVMNKLGVMENGINLDMDKLEEVMRSAKNPSEEAIKSTLALAATCKEEAEVSDDECEVAGAYFKCFRAAKFMSKQDEQ